MKEKTVTPFKKNMGFSLIELLVVLAIMTILIGGAGVGISLASSRDAQKSAKTIDNALAMSRLCAMSREGDFMLEIDLQNHKLEVMGEGEEALPGKVDISVQGISSVNVLQIKFDKSTGKVSQILTDGAAYADGVLKITSENPNGKVATVVLVTNTGKHFVEYK